MNILKSLALVLPLALVACGGGGGDPGSPPGGTTDPKTGTVSVQLYNGGGAQETSTNTISASDVSGHVKATVADASGKPVSGAIVTFAENGAGLLTFSPASGTALTDSNGLAEIDVKAASLTGTGATQITAAANIPQKAGDPVTVTGTQNIAVTNAVTEDPQKAAAAINFTAVDPADKSIVVAGAGGNGRSETALLTFTVVDSSGVPIKGVAVDFSVVPADSVTLNTPTGSTNSSGQVLASVSSKSQPTSVIVKATVNGRTISTQSDTLTVTTDIATQRGFDLSASKFNLDYNLSGDTSQVTVRVVDKNGNPVADGVPVVAVTPYGSVGSSGRGGCTTTNGACTIDYKVQNPRPVDGVGVPIVFSTQTGQGDEISASLTLWVTSVVNSNFYSATTGGVIVSSLAPTITNPKTCQLSTTRVFIGTPNGFALPSGTTITPRSFTQLASPSIVYGSPTLDRAATRTVLDISGTREEGGAADDVWIFVIKSPNGTVQEVSMSVKLPACSKESGTDTGTGGTGNTGGTSGTGGSNSGGSGGAAVGGT